MEPTNSEFLMRLRVFAKEPGALFMVVRTQRGPVPIWAEDINKAKTDAELITLVKSCGAEHAPDEASEHRSRRLKRESLNTLG